MKPRPSDSVTRCNLRAVVGPSERTLLPGHGHKWGHHGGLQGVRSVMVHPVDDRLPSATLRTTIFLEVCKRILKRTQNTLESLKASMVAGFPDMEAFRKSKMLL